MIGRNQRLTYFVESSTVPGMEQTKMYLRTDCVTCQNVQRM